jgi:hypothetical protein
MKKLANLILTTIVIVALSGCWANKKIVFLSEPSDAIVLNHYKTSLDSSKNVDIYKPTPVTQQVMFSNKNDTFNVTFEKRGYHSVEQKICRFTDTVKIKLERDIEIPEKLFKKADLKNGKLVLIDADVEVIIHSGVGRMDKYTSSAEKSVAVTDKFNDEFRRQANLNPAFELLNKSNDSIMQWNRKLLNSMKDYVFTLNEYRLDYMSNPPLISNKIEGFQNFMSSIRNQDSSANTYVVYIWAKCISETAGRIIGNVALAAASGVAMGFNAYYGYYSYVDLSALRFDSGTLLEFYVIDPKTSEVVSIDHAYYGYDITKTESLKKLMAKVIKYPELERAK